MERLMTDSLHGFLVQKAINSCCGDSSVSSSSVLGTCSRSSKGYCFLTTSPVSGGRDQVFSDFYLGRWRSFLQGELEGNRGSPANGQTSQAGLRALGSLPMLGLLGYCCVQESQGAVPAPSPYCAPLFMQGGSNSGGYYYINSGAEGSGKDYGKITHQKR